MNAKACQVGLSLTSALLIASTLVGCSTATSESPAQDNQAVEQQAAAEPQQPSDNVDTASRVKMYSSVNELAADSDLVVLARVSEKSDPELLNDFAFTNRIVSVEAVLQGEASGELTVFELGSGDMQVSLKPGTTHLLFLTEYSLVEGEPITKYVITGLYAGDYLQDHSGEFIRVDEESVALPASLPKGFTLRG